MKGVEISTLFPNPMPTTFSATNPLYISGGEVADDARRCTLTCSVMSIECVVVDVFQLIAVVRREGMSPGDIEHWPDLCRRLRT
jgi:hypothetical protein